MKSYDEIIKKKEW